MIPALLREVERRGHRVFTGGPKAEDYDMNLIAQRSSDLARARGEMPDLLSLVFRVDGGWRELAWPCSTVPGHHGLADPRTAAGVAVIRPGQYARSHRRGIHHGLAGDREALVQCAAVGIQRDADRDLVVDPAGWSGDGLFGINIHDDAGAGSEASEGCIVLARAHIAELLATVRLAEPRWGPFVTLTLIEVAKSG